MAEQSELFPVIEAQAQKKRSPLRQMFDAIAVHGPLVPLHFMPVAVNLSKQRVHELVKDGRIATITVADRIYVPFAALDGFLTQERKNGRPISDPQVAGCWRRARAEIKARK